jgi:TrpR-related protein YerC/YecD
MKNNLDTFEINQLFDAILSLETQDECRQFFKDICTVNELYSIAQRLKVAKLLYKRETYEEIEAETNASTATISRINKCLRYGADGYRRILERLDEEEED